MRSGVIVVLLAVGLAIGLLHPAADRAASAASPTLDAEVIASGSARTRIGRVSWTAVRGDATSLPFGQVFATPDGYAAFELPCCPGRGSRFWTSIDGLDWSVAPMPVPTDARGWHRTAGGDHWIMAPEEFRLWRSSDFASWTEVDMGAVEPPVVPGIRWTTWPTGLSAVGPTAVLPWDHVRGILALDELLGIDLGPDEQLLVEFARTPRDEPTVGDERPVLLWRGVSDGIGSEVPTERVGTIRILQDGSTVRVINAMKDAVVTTIDADAVGVPADVIAEGLNGLGQFDVPAKGIIVEGDVARPFDGPTGVRFLEPVGGRFVVLAGEVGDGPVVWASEDGVDWELLGPPILPTTSDDWSGLDRFELLEHPARTPSEPLAALVDVDGPRARDRQELWTSDDGHGWVRTSVLARRPQPSIRDMGALSRGYLGIGDDLKVHVSVDGRRWSPLRRLNGIGESIDRDGGAASTSVLADSLFHSEDPYGPERLLWMISIDPTG